MSRRRFFVDWIRGEAAELSGDGAEHLRRVLRAEVGQSFEISDDHAACLAEITGFGHGRVRFRVIEPLAETPAGVRVLLAVALFKFDRFEWMIEKVTELGVDTVQPVVAARSEKGLEDGARKRIERWRKIARSASEQSRRFHLPRLQEPCNLEALLAEPCGCSLVLDEAEASRRLADAACGHDPVRLLVGPEGGWTDHERARITSAGFTAVTLGAGILRAETAAMAGVALVRHG